MEFELLKPIVPGQFPWFDDGTENTRKTNDNFKKAKEEFDANSLQLDNIAKEILKFVQKKEIATLNWITPVLLGTWTFGGDSPLKFAKDDTGTVFLKGSVIYNGGGIGSQEKAIMVLPINYRSSKTVEIKPFYGSAPQLMRCLLRSDGYLIPYSVEPPAGSTVRFNEVYKAEA